jgi:hypothetical protein
MSTQQVPASAFITMTESMQRLGFIVMKKEKVGLQNIPWAFFKEGKER